MNSLEFYLKSAEKAIARWGFPYMLNDEDCIADVAHAMMKADMKFDGRGSDYGFRGERAKFAIRSIKSAHAKRRKNLSLDFEYDGITLGELVKQEHDWLFGEMQDLLKSSKTLNSRESKILQMYYFEDMTMPSIGIYFNLSKQRIEQIIKEALNKLRKEVE